MDNTKSSKPAVAPLSELASIMLANKRFAGKKCVICHGIIKIGEKISLCEGCKTIYHHFCWLENGGCGVYGCSKAPDVSYPDVDDQEEILSAQQSRSQPATSYKNDHLPKNKLPYATFGDRVAAYVIDALLLIFPIVLINLIFGNLLCILSTWLYYALSESSKYQGTLGKKIMGVKVTDIDGGKISFSRATGRHCGKFISSALLGVGFLMPLFTEKKQCLHDLIAECVSIKIQID